MTTLQADLTRFFSLDAFDTARTREIADVHVSPVQRKALKARLERYAQYGNGSQRQHAKRLLAEIAAL